MRKALALVEDELVLTEKKEKPMHPCHSQPRSKHPCASGKQPSEKLTRGEFLRALGTTAAAAMLAGCGPKAVEAPAAAPGQTSPTDQPAGQVEPAAPVQPVVAIAKTENYDRKLVRKQVEAMLNDIGGLGDILAHGNRVAIKVNLTGGLTGGSLPGIPEIESFLTHPEVVRALGELLRDSGVKDLFIVEAVYEKESWPAYGYTEIAETLGATLVDLNYAEPYKDFVDTQSGSNPNVYDKFIFNPILNEIDAFVSVGKMKCHNIAGVTHSVKNLFGLVPYRFYTLNSGDRYRSGFHGRGDETRRRVPGTIVDLNIARPIHLAVVDGIWTAEAGEGPWIPAMTQIKPGVLFAGKDPVATDAVATAAMGFDPEGDYPTEPFVHAQNHLNIAAKMGLGTNKLAEIKIKGPAIDDIRMKFTPSY
jgi:uncharacterized protein (DUF362 family)